LKYLAEEGSVVPELEEKCPENTPIPLQ